jgi:adenylate kinase family enzyme
MGRVMVVGQPGSGKSTFARALSARTGLPLVHLDRLHWGPGWVERPQEERLHLMRAAEAGERWIIEGNYASTWEGRAARADLLVWLDRPVGLRLRRVTLRLARHLGRSRPDLPEGCPERIGRNTLDFYHYIWATRRSGRESIARLAATAPCRVVRLTSDGEAAAFLDQGAGDRRAPGPPRPGLQPGEGA